MKSFVLKLFYATILLAICNTSAAMPLNELRAKYMTALHDQDKAESVYMLFLEIKEPSAKILAYRGALEAIMTKTTWNVFKKISYLNQSEESFRKAISRSPNDIEIRFMRLAVQYEIPEYLGFSNNKEEDKKFIVSNINHFDASLFPLQTVKEIYGFMIKCNYFSEEQIMKFKSQLALR